MNTKCKKTVRVKPSKVIEITIQLHKDVYDELKVIAKSECRTVAQQIKYFMSLGKDLIDNSGNAIISRYNSMPKEEPLESAIGFKVGE